MGEFINRIFLNLIKYVTRNGYTPGFDLSGLEIDLGTRELFEGKKGSFLPDLSPSVFTPFYAKSQ